MDEIKLKQCPFCGGKAKFLNNYPFGFEGYYVWCENCRSSSATYGDKTDAVEAWNRRTNDIQETNNLHTQQESHPSLSD